MSNKVPNSRRNLDIAIDRILGRETTLVTKNESWDTLYESQTEGLDVFQSVDKAIIWANELIQLIDNAHSN